MVRILVDRGERIMSSLTFYISIWTAFIIVGLVLYPEYPINNLSELMISFNEGFANGLKWLLEKTFSLENIMVIGGLFLGFAIAERGISAFVTGGGFSVLFLIPAILLFGIFTVLVNPAMGIIQYLKFLPTEAYVIISILMGILTFLTVVTFIGGRS